MEFSSLGLTSPPYLADFFLENIDYFIVSKFNNFLFEGFPIPK